MNARKLTRCAVLALTMVATVPLTFGAGFTDPLDQAARSSHLASQTLLVAVEQAGDRLVAVGLRGHIVYSDDQGGSWTQAAVPVSSDLTAVYFVNAKAGWAVGHDGVILHSQDGGASWIKQLDGVQASELLVMGIENKIAAGDESERMKGLLLEAIRYREAGPDKPFLDIWFSDENNGYAVGAYNLIFRTSDGGKHWESWFDRTDNPYLFHLNAIRGSGDGVYVVGEQGLFLRLDAVSRRFVARSTPYNGSFFSLVTVPGGVTAFGMRGNVYRTMDEGMSWQKIETGIESGLSGATVLDDGRIVAVSQAGQALISGDGGATFTPIPGVRPMPFSSVVAAGRKQIAISGLYGVQVEQLP
jgi:photosystem II stability/assembly factor-like uncharacterized protein